MLYPITINQRLFECIDVNLSRAILCNWTIKAVNKYNDLITLMQKEIKSGPLIQMDETSVQVLNENAQ